MAEIIPYQTKLTNGVGTITGTVALRSYNSSRQSLMIQNLGSGTLYLGGSTVDTTTGLQVLPHGDITLDNSQGAAVYCTADGTCNIRFLEEIL